MTKLAAITFAALSAMAGGAVLQYVQKVPAAPAGVRPAGQTPVGSAAALSLVKQPPGGPKPAPPAAHRPALSPSTRLPEEYELVERRSIFRSGTSPAAPAGQRAAQPAGDAGFTLKGIAQHGGEFVAFVERAGTGSVDELHVQHPLGAGRVVAMTLHSVDVEVEGKVPRVEVGQAIGTSAPLPPTATSPSPTKLAARPAPLAAPQPPAVQPAPARAQLAADPRGKVP